MVGKKTEPSYFPAAGGNCDSFRLTSRTLKNIFLVVGLVSESFYFLCGIPLARKEEEMSQSYVAVSAAMASASVGQRSIKFSFEEDVKDFDVVRALLVLFDEEEIERVQAMPGHVWLVVFKNSTLAEEATNGFILRATSEAEAGSRKICDGNCGVRSARCINA